MLRIVVEVKCSHTMAQGVKEHLAMVLEHFGDARVVEVTDGHFDAHHTQERLQCSFFSTGIFSHAEK